MIDVVVTDSETNDSTIADSDVVESEPVTAAVEDVVAVDPRKPVFEAVDEEVDGSIVGDP